MVAQTVVTFLKPIFEETNSNINTLINEIRQDRNERKRGSSGDW